jgi:hypothetical protein
MVFDRFQKREDMGMPEAGECKSKVHGLGKSTGVYFKTALLGRLHCGV